MAMTQETKFEVNGNMAFVHLPDDVKIVRLFAADNRVEITDLGGKPKVKVSDTSGVPKLRKPA